MGGEAQVLLVVKHALLRCCKKKNELYEENPQDAVHLVDGEDLREEKKRGREKEVKEGAERQYTFT